MNRLVRYRRGRFGGTTREVTVTEFELRELKLIARDRSVTLNVIMNELDPYIRKAIGNFIKSRRGKP